MRKLSVIVLVTTLLGGSKTGLLAAQGTKDGGTTLTSSVTNKPPPRFIWSPPLGYVFVEGNCGERDSILAWMSPPNPKSIREAQLVRFSTNKDGENWLPDFQLVTRHFIERWTAVKGRTVFVVPGNGNYERDNVIEVKLPLSTPYKTNSFNEATFLQGYAGGFMAAANGAKPAPPKLTAARPEGWTSGWKAGKRVARKPRQ